jgi:hypothetical protein
MGMCSAGDGLWFPGWNAGRIEWRQRVDEHAGGYCCGNTGSVERRGRRYGSRAEQHYAREHDADSESRRLRGQLWHDRFIAEWQRGRAGHGYARSW